MLFVLSLCLRLLRDHCEWEVHLGKTRFSRPAQVSLQVSPARATRSIEMVENPEDELIVILGTE